MNEKITNFLNESVSANDFPSAVYLVAEKGKIVFQDALGFAVVEPERIHARLNTIYDLASLTKVLVTGLLSAFLVEQNEIELKQTLGYYFPDHAAFESRDVTVSSLFTHTSGYRAWKPFYLFIKGRSEVLQEIFRNESTTLKPDVVYSDLNFLTLMSLAERIAGKSFIELARSLIFEPLGLENTFFNPDIGLRKRIAACEKGNEYEKQTCEEKYPEIRIPQSAFRTQTIWGEIHDGNAWFMGGIAGHAGLFSTAEEVFKIALQFLPDHTQLLKPETCELFRTNFTKGMNEDRSVAFQLASTKGSTAGTKMSPESFGHNGFTGTSLWIDPVKDRVFVLLTNRTHNHPLPFVNINSVRRQFHDLAIEALEAR